MQQVKAPQQVVERLISTFNQHRPDELEQLYSADARTRRPGWPAEAGVDELLSSYRMDLIAVPDLQLLPEATTSNGTTVFTELTITGTNTGPTELGEFGLALFGADVDRVGFLPSVPKGRERLSHPILERRGTPLISALVFRRTHGPRRRPPRRGCAGRRAARSSSTRCSCTR